LKRASNGAEVHAGCPGLLSIDVDVQLRHLTVIARLCIGNSGHHTNCVEHLIGRDLQAALLRTLHVDLNRLATSTKDGWRSHDGRTDSADRTKLRSQFSLDRKEVLCAIMLELHEDAAARWTTATTAANVHVREFDVGTLTQHVGD